MDGLALFTNLHADGPASLRRIRAARVSNLAELVRLPEPEFGALLRLDPAGAARARCEAISLAERLGELTSGAEETRADSVPSLISSRHALPTAELPRERPLIPTPLPRYPAPDRAPVEGSLLRVGCPKGLRSSTLEALVAEGVRTLPALIRLTSLALAHRTKVPFTVLLGLRYQARRELARRLQAGLPPAAPAADPQALRVVELRPEPRRLRTDTHPRRDPVFDRPTEEPAALTPGETLSCSRSVSEPGVAGPFG